MHCELLKPVLNSAGSFLPQVESMIHPYYFSSSSAQLPQPNGFPSASRLMFACLTPVVPHLLTCSSFSFLPRVSHSSAFTAIIIVRTNIVVLLLRTRGLALRWPQFLLPLGIRRTFAKSEYPLYRYPSASMDFGFDLTNECKLARDPAGVAAPSRSLAPPRSPAHVTRSARTPRPSLDQVTASARLEMTAC